MSESQNNIPRHWIALIFLSFRALEMHQKCLPPFHFNPFSHLFASFQSLATYYFRKLAFISFFECPLSWKALARVRNAIALLPAFAPSFRQMADFLRLLRLTEIRPVVGWAGLIHNFAKCSSPSLFCLRPTPLFPLPFPSPFFAPLLTISIMPTTSKDTPHACIN